MMALASVQKAFSHCHLRIPSVLQMKVLIRTCCWMCHPTAPSLRQSSSYQQQVLQLKQAQVVAPYTRTSSSPRNTIKLGFLSVAYLQAYLAKPHYCLCISHTKYRKFREGIQMVAFFAGNLLLNEILDLADGYYVCFSPFCIG